MPTRIETYPYPFNALMHNDWSSGQSILIKVYEHKLYIQNRSILEENWSVEHHKSRHINPLISNAFNKAGLVEKFGTGITKILDACKSEVDPLPLFSAASDGLDFSVTFKASKLYCALEQYRSDNDDAIIDYKKVISSMKKMPYLEDNSLDGGENCLDGGENCLDGGENCLDGGENCLDGGEKNRSSNVSFELLCRRKKLLVIIEKNPECTVHVLSEKACIPYRTAERDISWLRKNNFIRRDGSDRKGVWVVLKELN